MLFMAWLCPHLILLFLLTDLGILLCAGLCFYLLCISTPVDCQGIIKLFITEPFTLGTLPTTRQVLGDKNSILVEQAKLNI